MLAIVVAIIVAIFAVPGTAFAISYPAKCQGHRTMVQPYNIQRTTVQHSHTH